MFSVSGDNENNLPWILSKLTQEKGKDRQREVKGQAKRSERTKEREKTGEGKRKDGQTEGKGRAKGREGK